MTVNGRLVLDDINAILARRGLETRGRVQQYIDSEVLRLCDPLVPMRTGTLKHSGTLHTVIGSGEVKYSTPYARRQYYEHKTKKLWFERMKAAHKDQIIRGAVKIAGAKHG